MVTKRRCVWDKTFPLGHFMLHFIMFLIHQMTTKASNEFENCYLAGLVVQSIWSLPMTIQESIPVRCVLPAFVVLEWYGSGGMVLLKGVRRRGYGPGDGYGSAGGTSPHPRPQTA